MNKRIIAIIMVIILNISLFACNSKGVSNVPLEENNSATYQEPTNGTTAVTTATSTDAPTNEPTEVPTDTPTQDDTIKNDDNSDISLEVYELKGHKEFIQLSFENMPGASYEIGYKKSGMADYIFADERNLVKLSLKNDYEISGLSAGKYDICVRKTLDNKSTSKIFKDINVSAYDRSGYAHFNNNTGIGAYNNDGTLKENTIILNLTNENKNTIEAVFSDGKYTGIADILKYLNRSEVPVLIRIHGKITTNQWNYKQVVPRLTNGTNHTATHFENTFSSEYGENIANIEIRLKDAMNGTLYRYKTTVSGIVPLESGFTSKKVTTYTRDIYPELKRKQVYDDDTTHNCITISKAKNVTIEGVGGEAELFQWGMSFENSNSIEIRNLIFTAYPEDALCFRTSSSNVDTYGGYWVHHNTFNSGKNNWDLTGEQDKFKGDGALDVSNISNITVSYNDFNECGKTGLVGSSDTLGGKNVTFHHNYYNGVTSRLPLGRKANMHIYNNYYYNCLACLNIRSGGYVFSENNYFNNCNSAHVLSGDGTAIKSFNDIFKDTKGVNSKKVKSRTDIVANLCKPDGINDYSHFDTDSDIFYYDSVNKVTNVEILNPTEAVPEFVKSNAGINGRYNK